MKETEISPIDSLFWEIALKDNQAAFRTLFLQFFTPLCVFTHRYIESWESCEDVVQDTFFSLWKNRKNITIHTSTRNFLVTSVRNNCIDYLRKAESEYNWKQKEAVPASRAHTPGDLYSCAELEALLSAALAKLPPHVRAVFEQNRFEGLTYKEIANEHQLSVKMVEAYMSKALHYLRGELKDYLPLVMLLLG